MRAAAATAVLAGVFLGWALAQEPPRPRRIVTQLFATSQACAFCHSNAPGAGGLRDAAGRPVAPYDLWSGSMMANASRDPFFRAALAAEQAASPDRAAELEAKCLRCHAPMASEEIRQAGGEVGMDLFLLDTPWRRLADDGAACALCHQIQPDGLGTPASYDGGFVIEPYREIFGPHEDPFGLPMGQVVRFWPTEGKHVMRSALCATCHTLFAGGADGHVVPEQMPYLEWRNSDFSDEGGPNPSARTCQDCHLPKTSEGGGAIRTRIARDGDGVDFPQIGEREPFGRHLFVGGNTLLPAILRDHAEELGVAASRGALDETIAAARGQLRERTARLRITDVLHGSEFRVVVENLAGHKLPTGHPSRRVFLRVRIRDGRTGRVLFASGEFDARGRIVGADGAPLPFERRGGPVEPHRDVVAAPGEVAIWEAVFRDPSGAPVFLVTRAAGFGKDNRILPRGYRADGPDTEHTRPEGVGADDADFRGGSDAVACRVELPDEAAARYVVEADLFFQALAPRFAEELLAADAPPVHAFRRMLEAADPRPELVASARLTVTPQ